MSSTATLSNTQKGHPKGLYVLFVTEMWERFSYYGMRALFVLFMTKALLFDKAYASDIYGSYTGLVYLTPLIGGYMADHADLTNPSTKIAYCFANVEGYSKVGTYTGNANADGAFVYTGFRPAWVMCKLTTLAGESWLIKDSERSPLNPADGYLYADQSAAEATGTIRHMDFLSNGFKFKGHSTELNGNGHTYIYIAFAETPFKYSNAR